MNDEVKEILVVEGALDAIACIERGHPAVAKLRSTVDERLIKRLRRAADEGERIFYCPDATADVKPIDRCIGAGRIAWNCRVVVLPEGKDPDDLSGEELAQAKADAVPALYEWLTLLEALEENFEERRKALEIFKAQILEWRASWPGEMGEIRTAICAGLKLDAGDWVRWIGDDVAAAAESIAATAEKLGEVVASKDESVRLMPVRVVGAKRAEISNYDFVRDEHGTAQKDDKGKYLFKAVPLDEVRSSIYKQLDGEICALDAPGAKTPILFVPSETGVKWLPTPAALKALCLERATVRFNSRQDKTGVNYVGWEDIHQTFGFSDEVKRYMAVEMFPHEPPMKGHCYVGRPCKDYPNPDGRYIAAMAELFNQITEPHHRAIFLAAMVMPYWGGPCGERVAICFTADSPGSGKGKAAEAVGKPCGGLHETQMDEHAEQRLVQLLLDPKGLMKRVVRLDNMKEVVDSALLEALITWPEINGHRLGFGHASRPNNITVLLTANGARLSPDMCRRVFFVHLKTPKVKPPSWNRKYRELVDDNGDKMVADAIAVLKTPLPDVNFEDSTESFGLWAHEVLARVCAYPGFAHLLNGITVKEVLERNDSQRVEVDEDRERAEIFAVKLAQTIAEERKYVVQLLDFNGQQTGPQPQRPVMKDGGDAFPIFIETEQLGEYWKAIFKKREIDYRWVGRKLNEWVKAGRIEHIEREKNEARTKRGFWLYEAFFEPYVQGFGQQVWEGWQKQRTEAGH